jgi:hypothetical protein
MASRLLTVRRPDVCARCGAAVAKGDEAWWDAEAKTVTCLECHVGTESAKPVEANGLDRGIAGESAAREHERRRANRERQTREEHPRLGGVLLWLRGVPQHERAFRIGAVGEAAVGKSLEQRTEDGPAVVLHDRRMPGGRGNIDHVAVAPRGVFVIDVKAHSGKVRIDRPLFGTPKLKINGRDWTRMLGGLDRQVAAVRDALGGTGRTDVAVQGVLCFTTAGLPLSRTAKMRGHLLMYRKALAKQLNAQGPLGASEIEAIVRDLAKKLPPA